MTFHQVYRKNLLFTEGAMLANNHDLQESARHRRSPRVVHPRCTRDVQERSKAVQPLADALCARALVTVLGRNRAVNLAVDCCRFSDAGKGKLGTILARFWHNLGTNDFDILQLADFK
jgi:hypothetical protein